MTNMTKLQFTGGGTARISAPARTGDHEGNDYRQNLVGGGKDLPHPAAAAVQKERNKAALDQAVRHVSGYVQNITRELNFSIDEESGRTVVTVIDEVTGDVIRQIPTEDMLEMARNLAEIKQRTVKGLLFEGDA